MLSYLAPSPLSSLATDCTGYNSTQTQHRLFALYNIPPPRLFPPSPYSGAFTERQLSMRRKVEILKYNSSTGGGTATRAQKWSQLGRTQSASQYAVTNPNPPQTLTAPVCPSDDYLPTLTTQCDVPGPPEILYKDPSVPLYQYATQERAYASDPAASYVWRPITKNVVQYLTASATTIASDDPSASSYTTTCDVGVIAINNIEEIPKNLTFTVVSVPLAAWFVAAYTGSSGGGPVRPTDTPCTITVSQILYRITYNETTVVAQGTVPVSALTSPSFGPDQIPKTVPSQFYGIQYMGTVTLSNLTLANVQAGNIYQVYLDITYGYAPPVAGKTTLASRLAAMQTGFSTNIDALSQNVTTPNFAFASAPATPFVRSDFIAYNSTLPVNVYV
jgi:hypothetical protein